MKILWLLGILIVLLILTLVTYVMISSRRNAGNQPIEYKRDNIGDQSSGLRDRNVTIAEGSYSSRQLFDSIEKQGKMYFGYSSADIPDSFRIQRRVECISVQHTLELIFKGTEVCWVYFDDLVRLQIAEVVPLIRNRNYEPLTVNVIIRASIATEYKDKPFIFGLH